MEVRCGDRRSWTSGVHHLKLPVRDIARSEAWYRRTLRYRRTVEFKDGDKLMGILMIHPDGGPPLALRLDPHRAEAAAGFDYFIIGVPDHATIDELAAHLDALREPHGGVHQAGLGGSCPSWTTLTGVRCASTPWSITRRPSPRKSNGSMTPLDSSGFARGWSERQRLLLTEPRPAAAACTPDGAADTHAPTWWWPRCLVPARRDKVLGTHRLEHQPQPPTRPPNTPSAHRHGALR